MAFPWDLVITGASTLVAGVGGALGGAWLAGRQQLQRDRQQRRLDAYSGLALRLDELSRTLGAPQTLAESAFTGTLGRAVSQAVGSIQAAYFAVFLSGSKDVGPLAGKAWQAAWDIHNWFTSGDVSPDRTIEQLEALRQELRDAGMKFADAARKELA